MESKTASNDKLVQNNEYILWKIAGDDIKKTSSKEVGEEKLGGTIKE